MTGMCPTADHINPTCSSSPQILLLLHHHHNIPTLSSTNTVICKNNYLQHINGEHTEQMNARFYFLVAFTPGQKVRTLERRGGLKVKKDGDTISKSKEKITVIKDKYIITCEQNTWHCGYGRSYIQELRNFERKQSFTIYAASSSSQILCMFYITGSFKKWGCVALNVLL